MPPRTTTTANSLERRLLQDIAEIQQDPYPNVHLHFDDADIRKACVILTPQDQDPLHLTIVFQEDYPLQAPVVTIQTVVVHPNVIGGTYICASMLNTDEAWTPAYTLKGVVIQLLSFFCSESLEQDHGGEKIDLAEYRRHVGDLGARYPRSRHFQAYECRKCGFGLGWAPTRPDEDGNGAATPNELSSDEHTTPSPTQSKLFELPDELILLIISSLETRDVINFSDAVPGLKTLVRSYDFIRMRELQCFCLKKSFMDTQLGIGVAISGGYRPVFRSEFDLLSQEAFEQHRVRRSIQGVLFDKWLPLPLSRRHWNQVRAMAAARLRDIHGFAQMANQEPGYVDVLYHFMNTIVVQFSTDSQKGWGRADSRSTLSHASEKAVEAYFSLYHLLLCLATEDAATVAGANRIVNRFISGPRTKTQFPDLGHVLVAALISDAGMTANLTLLIIKEAILRNVVWMLDAKGAGYTELAYLEPSHISEYRLSKTFEASPTSYRLLMFLKLFSSAARPSGMRLAEIRDGLFETHGAPPPGTASKMAEDIRRIKDIKSFPQFLGAMGVTSPPRSQFSAFLRRTITDSVEAGYSRMPLSQSELYVIRKLKEHGVQMAEGIHTTPDLERFYGDARNRLPSFFPGQGGTGTIGRGNMSGRGRGRGIARGRGRGG
ncbi:hypothetical protein HBH56_062440 [Parastagonospora nodorum]|uniref:UBC core domain-containing protein n=1 Tax=Phaeosphaeria nodorum (strain SN15 / ATCC MYA-4574 / FGSC 10173) TaxID=321614 RepID=A0A7U2HX90_PHANO|nr:hypothetical protein HBH56_062440 [Parastagonospora nodorum]QRC92056.1 hypothetical protein JI435_022230 [Parastagonospora nodorum SN15]KAH3931000.1 hypothetical protein HBH54_106380 [Parastagonospora nodorum]KAH3954067.1 hypothetical protein HBH53_021320 [Parastagonospora nodorum]KAH4017818.1 hypothetical protein HBI09_194670 [Parastagonospora nodorum]